MNSEPPAPGPKPYRIPRLTARVGRLEIFEPRLALSANPGADLLIDALDSLNPAACVPLAAPTDLFQPQGAVQGQGSGAIDLLEQAGAIRDAYALTAAGQTVAVIDSGIAWDHVALGGGFGPGYRVVGGWDFAEDDADPYDDGPAGFHGTHVGGVIVGQSDSFSGIAPGADLVGLRVFDDLGRSSLDWIESALQWVYQHRDSFASPITTVNLSIGAVLSDTLAADVQGQLEDELRQLHDAQIVVVAAAGNAFDPVFPDRLNYPASSPTAWPVASTDSSGDLSGFSQREQGIFAAIGRNVTSSVPDHVLGMDGEVDDFHLASGTSMAAPQVAAASMLLRQAVEQVGGDASPNHLLGILRDTAIEQVDRITGQSYFTLDLAAAIASVLGTTAPGSEPGGGTAGEAEVPTAPTDLGVVQWQEIEAAANSHLRVTAAREGLFSIVVDPEHSSHRLKITNAVGQTLWNAPAPSSGQIDIPVVVGQALNIHTGAGAGPTGLQLANVLGVKQGHLEIASGPADPSVVIDMNDGLTASIGGVRYHFPEGTVISGAIDGGDRSDQLTILGSAAAARLILNPYAAGSFSEGGLDLALHGFEEVRFEGGGGGDRAILYDTIGDDTLFASPGSARLEGVGFRYEVSGVERSYVHATAGGQDMAFLSDSSGDDSLAVRPQFVSLRGSGFFNLAYGFERVYAYATEGGTDHADLYDSAGDDRLAASAASAMISGPGYYVQARHFDSVTGHATAGGHDLATMYSDDESGDARWIRTGNQVLLRSGDGADRIARGFESVETYHRGARVALAEQAVLRGLFAAYAYDIDFAAEESDAGQSGPTSG